MVKFIMYILPQFRQNAKSRPSTMAKSKATAPRLPSVINFTPIMIPLRKFPEGLLLGGPFLGKGEPPPLGPWGLENLVCIINSHLSDVGRPPRSPTKPGPLLFFLWGGTLAPCFPRPLEFSEIHLSSAQGHCICWISVEFTVYCLGEVAGRNFLTLGVLSTSLLWHRHCTVSWPQRESGLGVDSQAPTSERQVWLLVKLQWKTRFECSLRGRKPT